MVGPLTIAAVALSDEQRLYLATQGVMDSKKLRLQKILELAKVIRSSCLSYLVVSISPRTFNSLMSEVKREGKTLNDILAWGHARAVSDVFEELMKKGISGKIKLSIDMFDRIKTERRLKRILDLRKFDLDHHPKAEGERSVALPVLAGARIIFYISCESSIVEEHKIEPYRAQIVDRAVENSVHIVQANAPAEKQTLGDSHGQSRIIKPEGNIVREASIFEEEVLVANVDLGEATGNFARNSLRCEFVRSWWESGVAKVAKVPR